MIRKATEVWPQILLTRNQRQWLTRALCWWVFASAALEMTIAVILIAWWFVVAEESWHLVWMLSVPIGLVILAHISSALILGIWRTCDRCGFQLYPVSDHGVVSGGLVHRGPMNARLPDHRASRFMGSLCSARSLAWRCAVRLTACGAGTPMEPNSNT
jgi:hypothetical protein